MIHTKNTINSSIASCIILLLSLQSIPYVLSQSPPPPDPYKYAQFNPSIAIVIVILVALLFLMGFFSIYIRRRSNDVVGSLRQGQATRRRPATRGLDATVVETFPTFLYSAVKGLKIGKGALECAVCLNEYEDEETLRLIPKCDHVFHPECIDAWLENHVTCPVCRADLLPDLNELESGDSNQPGSNPEVNGQEPVNDTEELNRDPSVTNRPVRSRSVLGIPRLFEKFRSHSTGHSLVQVGENVDRFTLRLPEDVRKQIVNRALLNRTGEGSARKGYRTGTGVGRKSYKRLVSLDRVVVRSERWVMSRAPSFLTRAFSGRSPRGVTGVNEASTSSTTTDKIPLNNVGLKSC